MDLPNFLFLANLLHLILLSTSIQTETVFLRNENKIIKQNGIL
jgi:hypothetical protein